MRISLEVRMRTSGAVGSPRGSGQGLRGRTQVTQADSSYVLRARWYLSASAAYRDAYAEEATLVPDGTDALLGVTPA
jgi:hypothetical protein